MHRLAANGLRGEQCTVKETIASTGTIYKGFTESGCLKRQFKKSGTTAKHWVRQYLFLEAKVPFLGGQSWIQTSFLPLSFILPQIPWNSSGKHFKSCFVLWWFRTWLLVLLTFLQLGLKCRVWCLVCCSSHWTQKLSCRSEAVETKTIVYFSTLQQWTIAVFLAPMCTDQCLTRNQLSKQH